MSDVDALIRIKNKICPPYLRVFLKRSLRVENDFTVKKFPYFLLQWIIEQKKMAGSEKKVLSTLLTVRYDGKYVLRVPTLPKNDWFSSVESRILRTVWLCFFFNSVPLPVFLLPNNDWFPSVESSILRTVIDDWWRMITFLEVENRL